MAASEQMFNSISSLAFACFIIYLLRMPILETAEINYLLETQKPVPWRTEEVWKTKTENIETRMGW